MAANSIPAPIARGIIAQTDEVLRRGASARFDKIRQRTLFSSHLFAPGLGGTIAKGEYPLFQTLRGQVGQGYEKPLTDQETNWLSAGRVPDDQNLIVQAIGVSVLRAPSTTTAYTQSQIDLGLNLDIPPHAADVAAVAYGMTVNFKYLTSRIPQGYIADFPAVGGVVGQQQASRQVPVAASSDSASPNGVNPHLPVARQGSAACFERRLTVPQLLAAKDTFSMSLNVPNAIRLLAANASGVNSTRDSTGCLVVRIELFCTESVRNQG
jgi:hypothetical protein